jgi:uncharacterized protein
MKSKQLDPSPNGKTFVLVFDKGEEVVAGLKTFAHSEQLAGSHFTAIGAFNSVTFGFFDREQKECIKIPVHQKVAVLALMGNIGLHQDKPRIHAHVVIGQSDGNAMGGHLIDGWVWPTLEVIVEESPRHLQRRIDPEIGIPLLDPSLSQG